MPQSWPAAPPPPPELLAPTPVAPGPMEASPDVPAVQWMHAVVDACDAPRKPCPVIVMVPLTVVVPESVKTRMPPVVPFQAGAVRTVPARTVRLLYCGTTTTWAWLLAPVLV